MAYSYYSYLSGHDHNLQHIKETNSTVHYIVSGAGHEISDDDHHKVMSQQYMILAGYYSVVHIIRIRLIQIFAYFE